MMSAGMRRVLAVACALALAVGLAACGDDDDAAVSEGDTAAAPADTTLGAVVLTMQAEFYVAYTDELKVLADDAGVGLTVLDSDIKVEKQQANMEAMLTQGVNAISFSPVDDASAIPLVKQAQDQGASVVTLAVETDLAPYAVEDSIEGGKSGGVAAAEFFQKQNPGVPIKIALITQPQLQQTVNRADGFVEGVKSVDPTAEVVAQQDGGGALDTATAAAENLIQKSPDANVWFGINDPSALGALNALRSAGKGTIADGQLVVGFDGSAPALQELMDPTSALKVEVGNQPKVFANDVFAALMKLRGGEEVEHAIKAATKLLTGDDSDADIRAWYSEQWGGTLD
jgi:ribose transport system substrate-binding protein